MRITNMPKVSEAGDRHKIHTPRNMFYTDVSLDLAVAEWTVHVHMGIR